MVQDTFSRAIHIWLDTGEINQCHDDKIQLSQSGITKMFSKATGKIRAGQSGNQRSPCRIGELMCGVLGSQAEMAEPAARQHDDSLENTEVSCLNSQASSCLMLLFKPILLFSPIPHPSWPRTVTISITSDFLYKFLLIEG